MMIKKVFNILIRYLLSPKIYAKFIGVKMGNNVYLSTKNFSSEPYLISIGDNVRIAKNVSFFTHGGIWSLRFIYADSDLDYFGKIKIGNNTYIGESAMILPGVTIGDNCIIGAGSIVSKSILNNSIVGGNPIKYLGDIDDFYQRTLKYKLPTKGMNSGNKKKYLLSISGNKFKTQSLLNKENS